MLGAIGAAVVGLVAVLALPFRPQTSQIHLDALQCQFLLLLLQGLEQLLLLPISLLPFQLFRWNRFTGARLRMSVMGRPTGSLLRVLLLPPLGPPVLEPHLMYNFGSF